MFEYRRATMQDLEEIWRMNIADNPDDPRWIGWREEYIAYNQSGMAATYVVVCDGHPVGEGTLLFSPACKAVLGREPLADGAMIANVNALRIRKEYEGQGHISKMMRMMEADAALCGYKRLTIGVEACETRNVGIYLHWGYDAYVMYEIEEGIPILYYAKDLTAPTRLP